MPRASQMLTEFFGNNPRIEPGGLDQNEKWWVERQEALEQAGYMLRPRYRPGWKSSWAGTEKYHGNFEDGQSLLLRVCIDATRISDGRQVMLKMIPFEEAPYELEINRLFSTEPLSSNPRNRCAPLLDVIQLPNEPPIMVHPMLRPFYDPRFQTFGEFVSFFAQACEAIQFVHENHVAHRDCTYENIMLDPTSMYPNSFHPVAMGRSRDFRRKAKAYTRTRRPSRYVLIDFGLSRRYDPADGPPVDVPIHGGDKSAPELQEGKTSYNPFPTDVYYLGNLVREDYMEKHYGFEFMNGLIADMVQEDPTKRPTMDEVVARISEIKKKLSTWKARSRMVRKKEFWPLKVWRICGHWYRTIGYVLGRTPAIPDPK